MNVVSSLQFSINFSSRNKDIYPNGHSDKDIYPYLSAQIRIYILISISVREQRQWDSGTTQTIGTSAVTNLISSTAFSSRIQQHQQELHSKHCKSPWHKTATAGQVENSYNTIT